MKPLAPLHKETKEYIYPVSRREVCIKVEFAFPGNYDIRLVYWKRFRKITKKSKKMLAVAKFGVSKYYTVNLGFSDVIRYLNYIFEIKVGHRSYYYSPEGLTFSYPLKNFEFQNINESDVFIVPHSYSGQLAYHIIPERYHNGNKDNDPIDVVAWDSTPTRTNYFGGDLQGIAMKIPYLKELGVKTIFLTPIFKASSNHKYDTVDYYAIDPVFGTEEEFRCLVSALHKEGMRLILDGVFNHIGYYSLQFQDVISKGKKSPYWRWFFVYGDKVDTEKINYECVGDYMWMPKLNTANEDVQTFFEEVGLYWIERFQIDGWRLDVGDELDFYFRKHFRRVIKKHHPEVLIMAETWHNGLDLLRGDEVDSIMNYRLRDAIIDYLVKKSISLNTFIERIETICFDYPKQVHHILYNLIDSHDTPRFLTVAGNDKSLLFLAIVMQMFLPGMPVIYYGDEIGMAGETDPLCRAGMAWDRQDSEIFAFYKKMIEIRSSCGELATGDFAIIHNHQDVFAFTRSNNEHVTLVIINPQDKAKTFALDALKAIELGFTGEIRLDVAPKSYVIRRDI